MKLKKVILLLIGIVMAFMCCACMKEAADKNTDDQIKKEIDENVDDQIEDKLNENIGDQIENEESEKVKITYTEKKSEVKEELVGIWHAAPTISIGYDDCIFFFSDGTFKIVYSRYKDGRVSQLLASYGEWGINDQELILTMNEQKIIADKDAVLLLSPSSPTGYELAGKTTDEVLEEPKQVIYSLGAIEDSVDASYEKKVAINDEYYWKISDDPNNVMDIEQGRDVDHEEEGIKVFGKWKISKLIKDVEYASICPNDLLGKTVEINGSEFVDYDGNKMNTSLEMFITDSEKLLGAEFIKVPDDSKIIILNFYQEDSLVKTLYSVDDQLWLKTEDEYLFLLERMN